LLPWFRSPRARAYAGGKEHAFSFYGKLLALAAATAALAAAAYAIPSLVHAAADPAPSCLLRGLVV
jgi:hypothetical protein